ncbi:MAG: hypothetical protein ACRDYV_00065 [Acidimicrobiia bacterium]
MAEHASRRINLGRWGRLHWLLLGFAAARAVTAVLGQVWGQDSWAETADGLCIAAFIGSVPFWLRITYRLAWWRCRAVTARVLLTLDAEDHIRPVDSRSRRQLIAALRQVDQAEGMDDPDRLRGVLAGRP